MTEFMAEAAHLAAVRMRRVVDDEAPEPADEDRRCGKVGTPPTAKEVINVRFAGETKLLERHDRNDQVRSERVWVERRMKLHPNLSTKLQGDPFSFSLESANEPRSHKTPTNYFLRPLICL